MRRMGGEGVTGERRPPFEETYQLGKELGHGSFSTVREGVHKVRLLFLFVFRRHSCCVTKLQLICCMILLYSGAGGAVAAGYLLYVSALCVR